MLAKQLSLYDYIDNTLKNLVTCEVEIKAEEDNIQKATFHMDTLHKGDDGYITIAIKHNNDWAQHHYKIEELKDNVGKVLSIDGVNIYLSPNSFYKPIRRIENVRKLNSLYIDLDYYTLDKFKDLTVDQILWNLEAVPYKALPLWNAVQKNFLNKLKDIGADEKSIDAARVMRLGGSVNQKNGHAVDLLFYNDNKYNLRDIQENYLPDLTPYVKNPYHKAKGRHKKVVNLFNLYSLHYARLRDLVKLMELREGMCRMEDGSLKATGLRELMCFLYRYWSSCYEGDTENALKSTLDFNKQFKEPLSTGEVERATKSATKAYKEWLKDCPTGTYSRGGYNYKNKTLIKLLNITEEEMKNLETIISNKEVKRRTNIRTNIHHKAKRRNEKGLTKRQQEKKYKEEKVKELIQQGFNKSQIAKELDLNRSTITRSYNHLFS
ncbi:DNA-binding response regulator [Clostridium tetani]|uniref:DNA-binding response regulator n=1 Tax=Clostridium tetani TaxID=1513 RepID=UPI00100B45A8|nr:DNA-binding response regulator [Clostridium tetani]RXM56722.1 DNA-binding response regulator [Clostridium tetani]RXM74250.1 DNA-binding response regulator [Clostridium tetani]RYU98016.1 DNA-binding response regulator [Clostridium tetani]